MQWCVGMARGAYGIPGTPGVVYQLEMSAKATWRRVLALRAGVTKGKCAPAGSTNRNSAAC